MPGIPSTLRKHADCKRAAMLAHEGAKPREIAELLNVKPESVRNMILFGRRLISEEADGIKGE